MFLLEKENKGTTQKNGNSTQIGVEQKRGINSNLDYSINYIAQSTIKIANVTTQSINKIS